MQKSYTKQSSKKQPKKQYTSGAITKLQRSNAELGFREPSKNKHYYAILSNGKILDFTGKSRAHAKQYFESEAKVLYGLNEEILIRAYQK